MPSGSKTSPPRTSVLRQRVYSGGLNPVMDLFAKKFGGNEILPRTGRKRCYKGTRVGPGKSKPRDPRMINYRNVCAGDKAYAALKNIRAHIIKTRMDGFNRKGKYRGQGKPRIYRPKTRVKRKLNHKLRLWIHALKYVKKKEGITGFVKIGKSHRLYGKVRRYYDFLLARYPEKSVSSRSLKRISAARARLHRAVLQAPLRSARARLNASIKRRVANRRRKASKVRKASPPRRMVTRATARAMAAPRRSSRRRLSRRR